MIRRTLDPTLINRISNESAIRTVLARHGGPLKWDDVMRGCVVLTNDEDAVQVYEQTADRDWQVVTIFGETCRGRRALEVGREMRSYMLPLSDLIFGSVPNNLPHAQWFYRQMGGERVPFVESGGYVYTAQPDETLMALKVAA